MSENFILQTLGFESSSDALHDEIPELQAIDQRLLVDKANRNGQGFFARAVDAALSSIWHSDLDSEKALEALRLKVVAAQESADPGAVKKLDEEVQQAVENDQKAVQNNSFKDSASSFVGDVAVSAPLFVRGARGSALSAFANGLNDFSASDGPGGMAADALTGAAKGYLLSRTFESVGQSQLSLSTKGTILGILNTTETNLLTASNYRDREGNFALGQGLSITASSTFNPLALLTDVSTGIASRSIAKIADGRLDGFLSRSPLATNVLTGTTTGLISGSSAEIQRESRTGNYDFESILAGAA